MTTVIAFIIGVLSGATIAFVLVAAKYGTDSEDYYKGSNKYEK